MQGRRLSRQMHVDSHFIDLEYRYQPHRSLNVSYLRYQSTLPAASAPNKSVFPRPLGTSRPLSTLIFRLHSLLKLLHSNVNVLNVLIRLALLFYEMCHSIR